MNYHKTNNYILFWLSQAISQLGSSMTSFALVIWAYTQTNSVMTVSLLTFFSYAPYVLVSIFAGSFVDNHKKKSILLWTDLLSGLCSMIVWILFSKGNLQLWHIYLVNGITGLMNAFQSPASTVAVGMMVPKDKYEKLSGMNSFSTSIVSVVTPMLAASISSFFGLTGVLFIDMLSFGVAFLALLLVIFIPEQTTDFHQQPRKSGVLEGALEGFDFLREHKGLLYLIFSMAIMNFFSRLTYENILPAMILSRSGNNQTVLGFVSGMIGFGGILGGVIVTIIKLPKNKIRVIYFSAAISFLCGDLLMGLGESTFLWALAALAASIPISFINAGQSVLLYSNIPTNMQGRVFAVRNGLQYLTVPIGVLLGGALADYVFEPYMKRNTAMVVILQNLVGTGEGNGMAVMFLCTGILGFIISFLWYKNKHIQALHH